MNEFELKVFAPDTAAKHWAKLQQVPAIQSLPWVQSDAPLAAQTWPQLDPKDTVDFVIVVCGISASLLLQQIFRFSAPSTQTQRPARMLIPWTKPTFCSTHAANAMPNSSANWRNANSKSNRPMWSESRAFAWC